MKITMGRLNAAIAGAFALGLGLSTAHAEAPKCQLRMVVELPVTMVGMAPTIPVKINGKETRLMADSGAFYSTLPGSAPETFGLQTSMAPVGFYVKGANGTAQASIGKAKDFEIAAVPLKNIDFLIAGRDLMPGVSGMIGQNILGIGDVEYDLANGAIRLFKPKDCGKAALSYWTNGKIPSILPIDEFSPTRPRTTSTAWVNGNKIKVMFDTGASFSVLKRSAAEKVGIQINSDDVEPGGLSSGIGKRLAESWISPVEQFAIGDEQVLHTRLRIGDVDLGEADMLIGADFFLSHRVYVANSQRKLYFTYNGGPVFKLNRSDDTPPSKAKLADTENLDADGYSRRASAYMARRDYEAAEADYGRALGLEPKKGSILLDRAKARLSLGRPVLALEDLTMAIGLDPKNAEAVLFRGQIYLREGDKAKARSDFELAVMAAPDSPDVRRTISMLYEREKDYPAAIAELDAWFVRFPKNDRQAEVRNERCWLLGMQGTNLGKALEDCNIALKVGRNNSAFLDSRGMVNLRLGNLDAAIADYDAAIKLQPKQAWSLYGRGLAKQKKGLTSEGAADIAAGLELKADIKATAKQIGLIDDTGALKSPPH